MLVRGECVVRERERLLLLFGMNDDKNDFPSQLFLPKPQISRCYNNHYSFEIDYIVNRVANKDKDKDKNRDT